MIRNWKCRTASTLVAIALLVLSTGCTKITTDYGYSSSHRGTQSLNGFSALRQTFANTGYECKDVRRLSDRQNETDTLVWTPQVLSPIEDEMTNWFDQWLAVGGHTLVYIVPDSGSEADYWLDATRDAPPSQQLEYRRRAARAVNDRFEWRLNRDAVPSNGWFQIQPIAQATSLGELKGRWSESISQSNDFNEESASRHIEFAIQAYQAPASTPTTPATASSGTPSATPQPSGTGSSNTNSSSGAAPSGSGSSSTANTPPVINSGPTGPSHSYGYYPSSVTPTATQVKFEPLLSSETGTAAETCFVGQVTSSKWKNSRVIVVAGGSLLTNYAFTTPFTRALAEEIVDATIDPSDSELIAGFITSEYGSVPISELKPGETKASGMELLTTWPLSLVTIHAVFLGIVALLILLPIFGRPRQVLRSSLSRFGDHLDAVAALMFRAGGEEYARRRISEYHRRVRGETTGPWVLPETQPPKTPTLTPPVTEAAGSTSQTPANSTIDQANPNNK